MSRAGRERERARPSFICLTCPPASRTTHPTAGLGAVWPRPRRAMSRARRMWALSARVMAEEEVGVSLALAGGTFRACLLRR